MIIAMPTVAVARYFEAADVIASDAAASGNVRAVTPITMKDAGVLSNGTWLVSQAAEAIKPLAGHRQTGTLAVVICTQTVVMQQEPVSLYLAVGRLSRCAADVLLL
jgi:phage major head subunit gpT-like protein